MLEFFLLFCCVCIVNGDNDTFAEEIEIISRNDSIFHSCQPVLAKLYENADYHTLVGCKLMNATSDLDSTMQAALNAIPCDQFSSDMTNLTESVVQNYILQTANARKAAKVCIDSDDTLTLFIISITNNTDKSLSAYFESKRISHQLVPNSRREKIFRVFPRINIKLPSDFFYPFSCTATRASSYVIAVLLTILALGV